MGAREDVGVRVDIWRGRVHVEIEGAALARVARRPRSRQEHARRLVLDLELDPDLLVLVRKDLLDLLAGLVSGRGHDRQRGANSTLAADAIRPLDPAGLA